GSNGPIFDTAVGSKPGASVSGLKLTGTTNSGFGGAIYNTGILSIDNCVISGNTADFGGGIHNQGGVITIDACTITQNTANAGGAISNQGGTVTVNNSTISSNSATSQNGGGITTFGSDCPSKSGTEAFLFVNNSALTGNSIQGNGLGGGVCNSLSGFAQLV